jgi:hypothetical protein
MTALAMLLLTACGENQPEHKDTNTPTTGRAVFNVKLYDSTPTTVKVKGGSINLINELKSRVTSINIAIFDGNGSYLTANDYPVVDGAVNTYIDLPPGSYTFSVACNNYSGKTFFDGNSSLVAVINGQVSNVTIDLQTTPLMIDFAISEMPGNFDKVSGTSSGSPTYSVATITKTASGDSHGYTDNWAFVDVNNVLHFTGSLLVSNNQQLFFSITDKDGKTYSQGLSVGTLQVLNEIDTAAEIEYAYITGGDVNIGVTFPTQ